MVRLQQCYKTLKLLLVLKMSQFHYGSITTQVKKYKVDDKNNCLNSTMVRLQQITKKQYASGGRDLSQFHYGSITTR